MTQARQPRILSYADRLSAAPGETVEVKVSSLVEGDYEAALVRLRHGDRNPAGPGFKEAELPADFTGAHPARFQGIDAGSCVVVEDADHLLALDGGLTLHAFIAPTMPSATGQVIMSRYDLAEEAGYALSVGPNGVTLRLGLGGAGTWELETEEQLYPGCWYSVGATLDADTLIARVWARQVVTATNSRVSRHVDIPGTATRQGQAPSLTAQTTDARFLIGALDDGAAHVQHFNGKLERPAVWSRALDADAIDALASEKMVEPRTGLLGLWDFAANVTRDGVSTDEVVDLGPWGLRGTCVNGPARGMTGRRWRGVVERYTEAPEEYAAIHFHEDDLLDCEWDTDFTWVVPDDLPSGTYAVRITQDDEVDRLPLFVLPPRHAATADVALIIGTASYLAYANERLAPGGAYTQSSFGHTPVLGQSDMYLHQHPELGLSLYDLHADGSGVHLSSSRRPIINLRPDKRTSLGGPWQFPADLHLVDWLEEQGISYDVLTDLEVHQQGAEVLNRYRVVLTGSHPEYITRPAMEAWEEYLATGGRVLYLGGNGFYWVTDWHPQKPYVVEVRRGESGPRSWQAEPGELHLQTNGERGGLWRWRGRAPHKLVGVGFSTQGFDASSYFVQADDVADPAAAFIFEGVDGEERIGDFGLEGGGAAGFELDRYDLTLGTPPGTLLLAHSHGLSDNYTRVPEEVQVPMPHMTATMDYQCRGDLTYFRTKSGGAVFSASSIAWCGSLAHQDYQNNVSRITGNVVRRFLDPAPLEKPSSEVWA